MPTRATGQPIRLTRRRLLALAVGSLVAGACRGEIDMIAAPGPAPEPTLPVVPTLAFPRSTATPIVTSPTPGAAAAPAVPAPSPRGPIAPAVGASSQQSVVVPVFQPRALPYRNRALPPERLLIPSIGLDSRVIELGTTLDKDGRAVWETAPFAVGHHKGTALPGELGNVVLSGHISSPREGAVFQDLPKVRVGDGVVVATAERHYLYVVRSTKVVTPDAIDVLDSDGQPVATLITCVPDRVYSHRLIVRADAV